MIVFLLGLPIRIRINLLIYGPESESEIRNLDCELLIFYNLLKYIIRIRNPKCCGLNRFFFGGFFRPIIRQNASPNFYIYLNTIVDVVYL